MRGWPHRNNIRDGLQKYENRKDELTIEEICIMWGYRVIVPKKLQDEILSELHATHAGIVRMKSVARLFFWWPNIDKDVERRVRSCGECAETRDAPPKTPAKVWFWPEKPWQRLHTDFIGPFQGYNFLLIIDARTKWPEVEIMKSVFQKLFSRFGLPHHLVGDNGTQYTSAEFASFLQTLGVKHTFSPVKHPTTNGAAENFVKS